MISKYVVVASFLAAVAAASVIQSEKQSNELVFNYGDSSDIQSHTRYHIVMGERLYGDVLQFEERVQVHAGGKVRFNVDPKLKINSVVVLDLNQTGNGDYPIPVEGGVGKKFITLQFLSESQQQVDFFVTIYAI